MVGHADVRTVFQQLGWYANLQILCVEHMLFGITHCLGMMQRGAAPLLAVDVLRADSHQFADGILYGTDVAAGVDDLRLHAEIGCLHLVDGSAIGLAVLPKRLFGLERLVPETVGLHENFQLAVEHLQQEVLLSRDGNEVRTYGLFLHLSLQEHSLCCALLVGNRAEDVDIHR